MMKFWIAISIGLSMVTLVTVHRLDDAQAEIVECRSGMKMMRRMIEERDATIRQADQALDKLIAEERVMREAKCKR